MVDIVELGDNEVKFQKAYKDFMVAKPEDAKARFQEMRDAFAKLPKKEGGGIEDSVEFELPRMKPIAKGFKDVLASSEDLDQDKATKLQNTAFLADLLLDLQEGKKEIGKERYDKLASLIEGKNFDEKAIQETLDLKKPISIKKDKDGSILIEVDKDDLEKLKSQKINKEGKAEEIEPAKAEEKSKFRDPRKAFPSYEKLAGFVMAMMIACTVFPPLLPFAAPAIGIALAIGAVKTVVEVVGAVVDAVVGIVTGVKTVGKAVIDFGKEVKDLGGKFIDLFGAAFKAAYKGVTGKSWDEKSPGPEDKIAEDMKKAKEEGKGVVGTVQKGLETAGKEADATIEKANKLQRDNLEKDLKGKGASESQIKGVLDALEKSQKDPSLENKLAFAKAQSSLDKDLKQKAAVMKDLDKKGATPEQKEAVAKAMENPKDLEAAKAANKVMMELEGIGPRLAQASKAPIPEPITPAKGAASEPSNPSIAQKQEANRNLLAEGLKGRGASDKQIEAAVGALKDVQEGKSARKEFDKTMAGIDKDLKIEGKVREGVEDKTLADKTVKALRGEGELSAEDAKKAMAAMANKDGSKPVNLSPKEAFEAVKAQANKDNPKPEEEKKAGLLDKITAKFTSFTDGVKGLFSSSKTPDTKSAEMKDMTSRLADASKAPIPKPLSPAESAAKPKEPESSISSPVGTASKSEPAKPKEPLGAGQEPALKPEKTSAAALDLAVTSKNSDVAKAVEDMEKTFRANKEAKASSSLDGLDLASPSKSSIRTK